MTATATATVAADAGVRPWLDAERCYRAVSSRDRRFDGWFYVAVHTTGIYCRPSCPARTPHRRNVEFLASAAAAQQRGFRACKRCRPDAAPGSPDWDVRADVAARAMRLVADGVVDREGVPGLAARLGYSARHLNRLLVDELGASALALARSQRAHTARVLIETTDVALTDTAFAAGFASVRQFNDTIREVYDASPTEMRTAARRRLRTPHDEPVAPPSDAIRVRLATRAPFDGAEMVAFLAARAVPGIEHHDGTTYRRALRLPNGHGVAVVRPDGDALSVTFRLASWRDLTPAVQRIRRLFDLDADPHAVDAVLGADPVLAPWVTAAPGRRVAGSVDPFETAVRAIIGQQVSIAGARTIAGRLVTAVGERLTVADGALTHVFPAPAALADVVDDHLPMPAARRRAVRALAAAVADGSLELDVGADRATVRGGLLALPGVGPWTADYVVMRGLSDPDVFLPTDLGVRHALTAAGAEPDASERWRPWRSYALHHLWASLSAGGTATHPSMTRTDTR